MTVKSAGDSWHSKNKKKRFVHIRIQYTERNKTENFFVDV